MKRAIQQTIVPIRREEVRDDRRVQEDRAHDKTGCAGDNFHTLSDGGVCVRDRSGKSQRTELVVRDR